MNRIEYMNCLANRLKRLPKEDYDKAMEYFNEYFDEAGPENEQQAIEDLGVPELAANQIVMDMALKNVDEPDKSVKRSFKTVWLAILAVFAAPIALPVAIAVVACLAAVLVAAGSVLLAVVVAAAGFAITSVVGFLGSLYLLFASPANGLATLGLSIFCIGVSIFVVIGSIKLGKLMLNGISKLFGKMIKGGKKHAQ